eukprot:snap_masked-scaffold_1-processed-gene-19.65-mRNA-1 protein AED:1.00 eAED:1.00 QI:0/0/0/0/1/1/2/0/513
MLRSLLVYLLRDFKINLLAASIAVEVKEFEVLLSTLLKTIDFLLVTSDAYFKQDETLRSEKKKESSVAEESIDLIRVFSQILNSQVEVEGSFLIVVTTVLKMFPLLLSLIIGLLKFQEVQNCEKNTMIQELNTIEVLLDSKKKLFVTVLSISQESTADEIKQIFVSIQEQMLSLKHLSQSKISTFQPDKEFASKTRLKTFWERVENLETPIDKVMFLDELTEFFGKQNVITKPKIVVLSEAQDEIAGSDTEWIDELVPLLLIFLFDLDSYVYLSAVKTCCSISIDQATGERIMVQLMSEYVNSCKDGTDGKFSILGEAILFILKVRGQSLYPYASSIANILMQAFEESEDLIVKQSVLSLLAQILQLTPIVGLKFLRDIEAVTRRTILFTDDSGNNTVLRSLIFVIHGLFWGLSEIMQRENDNTLLRDEYQNSTDFIDSRTLRRIQGERDETKNVVSELQKESAVMEEMKQLILLLSSHGRYEALDDLVKNQCQSLLQLLSKMDVLMLQNILV